MPRYFWVNKKWPLDTADYVFLGRAVDRIGAALFPGEWDGCEFAEGGEHFIPDDMADADASKRAYVSKRLAEAFPDYSPQFRTVSPPSLTRARPSVELEEPSPSDWQRGLALLETESLRVRNRLIRRNAAMGAVVENAANGLLHFGIRPVKGGTLEPLATEAWHIENWEHRFQYCQIKPSDPFSRDPGGEGAQYVGYAYIFVSKASLKVLENPERHNGEAADQSRALSPHAYPDLSPYMKALLAVSVNLGISPTNQPKKESLKADITAAWNYPFPLSERILDAMATILREPESQAGKNRTRKG